MRPPGGASSPHTLEPFVDPARRQATAYPVLTVALSPVVVARAEAYAQAVERNLPPRPNYSGFEPPNRYRNGYLGEFAFVILLQGLGRKLVYEPRADGQSDAGPDVYVWMGEHKVGVNVRAGGQPTHQYMMLPEAQWQQSSPADLYLGARLDLDGGACELWGTAWRERMDEAPVRNPEDDGFPRVLAPTRLLRLSVLEPLVETLDALAQGPAEIKKAIP